MKKIGFCILSGLILLFIILLTGCGGVPPISIYRYIFVADGSNGLVVIDMSDLNNPVQISGFDLDNAVDIYIQDIYAFVADSNNGIVILDTNDRNNITEKSTFSFNSNDPRRIFVKEISGKRYAFIANGYDLRLLDASDPSNPVEKYIPDIYTITTNVFVDENNYLYVTDMIEGLKVINAQNPEFTLFQGEISINGAYSVYVSGNYAYVASTSEGLVIVDVSNPANPSEVTSISGNFCCVTGKDNYVFVSGADGLYIVDVSNPQNPQVVYSDPQIFGLNLFAGESLYVAAGTNGVLCYDIQDPTNPALISNFNTDGYANGIFVMEIHQLFLNRK